MPKFQFRLQSVLDHKQRLEDVAQVEHAQAQTMQVREEGALSGLVHDEQHAVDELERQRFTGRLDIECLQLGMGYLDGLKVQLQRQEQVVERVRRHTTVQREKLIEAMQERKTLDRLREKQRDVFTAEQDRRETIENDEMVVMRHARQMIVTRQAERTQYAALALSGKVPTHAV